jgi:diguanylate cyclase (GGDEF)-like protein/PAS domain S-box-containing protein
MNDKRKLKAELISELDLIRQQLGQETHTKAELEARLEAVHEERAMLEARYQANLALHSTLQYDEVLDQILSQVNQIVPHDAACIILTQGDTARVFRWHGYARFGRQDFTSHFVLEIDEIYSLRSARRLGRPIVIPEATEGDDWVIASGQDWIQSYISVPIRVGSQVMGFLNVDSATAGFFSQQDAGRLQAFIVESISALRNAWLYNQARREITERIKALKKERDFNSAILNISSALVVVLDAEQRIVRINRACEKITNYSIDEVAGKQIWDIFTTPDESPDIRAIYDSLTAGHFPSEHESYWVTKNGSQQRISWTSTVLQDHYGAIDYIISTGFDITERKQMEEALRQSEERYALAALATNDGLWDWDLKTYEIYFSGRWKAMLGYQEHEIGSDPDEWFNLVHPEDLVLLKQDISAHLKDSSASLRNEHRMRHRNGEYRWMLTQWLAVRNQDWQPYRLIGSQTDITERKLAEARLRHASLHDALTDLPNRILFTERLDRAVEQASIEKDYKFAVLFLDLDRFKVINDSLGHLVGDQFLIIIADRLKACLRSGDTVARLGGDEFAMLIENIRDTDEAITVADRVQSKLSESVQLADQEIVTSASIGIALSTTGYESSKDILRDADTTMYRAKARGKARHEVFKSDMADQAMAVWEMESELRSAVENQEFELYYQPFVSLESGKITGVEALLRWRHPKQGLITPDKFISLAEETGLIIPIGEWVVRTACKQAQRWREAGHHALRLGVNVSFRQLQDSRDHPCFADVISRVLADTQLEANLLELEITETHPVPLSQYNLSVLKELKSLGVQIALDDFGISSSLTVLKQFPIDTLKVDRSFVQDITNSPDDAIIIDAIIGLAHGLKLNVVAEGVETKEHLAWLRERRCDEVQGFLFSRPLPAHDLGNLLREGADVWDISALTA